MQTGFSNQDLLPDVGGVQLTSPVSPGVHEFALSFQLPYQGSNADLTLQLPYPTGTYTVYVPDQGPKVSTSGLTAGPPQQLGGQSYTPYTASNVARSTVVPLQFTGLGATSGLSPNQLAMMSLGVVLLVLGGGVLLWTVRRPVARVEPPAQTAESVEQERLQLLVRLATLDDRFTAGEIAARDYEAERERGKRRLVELTLLQRGTRTASS
jgi:uncharacterized iron-regulated membrane protein